MAPEYERVGSAFANEEDVLIVKVNAEEETQVASKYDIKGFPTLKFFPKGGVEPIDFDGKRDENGIIEWINKKAGTSRKPGGGLESLVGTIKELNVFVTEFYKSDKEKILKETKVAASKIKSKYTSYYYKVMEKVIKAPHFIKAEIQRLDKILQGDLTPSKRDDFNVRLNILNIFTSESSGVAEDEL